MTVWDLYEQEQYRSAEAGGPEFCFFITSLVDVDGLLHDECRMGFMIDYVFSVC
jgi:hypothetical protein